VYSFNDSFNLVGVGLYISISFFSSQEKIRESVLNLGYSTPLILILIQILQFVITPISHYAVRIVRGFVFRLWYRFIFNYIRRTIGHLIAFYFGRKYGKGLVGKAVKKETMQKYDNLFDKGKLILFLMYSPPLFPDDELSYLAGISPINSKAFVPIMLIGHISGRLSLAYSGNGLSISDPLFILLSLITLIGGIFFLL